MMRFLTCKVDLKEEFIIEVTTTTEQKEETTTIEEITEKPK